MKNIFEAEGLAALKGLCAGAPLIAFDFDGTLAPIVEVPTNAHMKTVVSSALERFCAQQAVAVISGRALADLRPRLPENVAYAIGNHGLEGPPRANATMELAQATCQAWGETLRPRLSEMSGVEWEDKTFTASLHYRRARPRPLVRARLLQWVSELAPTPRPVLGKNVINLLPPGPANKGLALLELMMHLHRETAIYVGDDDTDEDVFSIAGQRILGIRVGRKEKSAARYYLPRQSDIGRLIDLLDEFLGSGKS